MTEAVPGWLAAWRAGQHAPTLPEQQAAPPLPPTVAVAPAQAAPAKRQPDKVGYLHPEPWTFDGGLRREPVLDTDCHPPRIVRRVGWQRCIKCRTPFWSEDVTRIRMCIVCRMDEDRFA